MHIRARSRKPTRTFEVYPLATAERKPTATRSLPPRPQPPPRRRAMASVAASPASCSCSTVFASSSSTPIRTPRPSLRPLPRRARLPLAGRSVLRCLPKCDSGKLPPPVGGGAGLSIRKAAEPAGRGGFRAARFDASCGLAFATVAGVLMLQGTQQAMAATQFGGLQPADVLGDLGDLSTGFASVKRTASAL
uniref:Uncharacterized protein n=1 Tax=Setaria italica TaxID=4555 RepID=K3XM99_SETIT